jgi:hypothetical protein
MVKQIIGGFALAIVLVGGGVALFAVIGMIGSGFFILFVFYILKIYKNFKIL